MIQQNVFIFLFSILVIFVVGCKDSSSSPSDSDTSKSTDSQTEEISTEDSDTGPERPQYTPETDSEETTEDTTPLTCFMSEECGASIPSERIVCPYPLTPTMDGALEDDAWQSSTWEFLAHDFGNAPADDDTDASVEFACVADADYIYVAYRIHDDVIYTSDASGCDVWDDDSVEFYIDTCYERNAAYNGNDAQIAVGAENIDVTDQSQVVFGGCNGAPVQGPETGSISYSTLMDGGWMGEIAIPLHPEGGWSLDPSDGQVIGFNLHYNDDDDGGDRDHKLIWSTKDRYDDASWQDTTKFGELQFCNIGGNVEPDGGVEDGGVEDAGSNTTPDAGPTK
jgi:hypothetical protein